jgi:hypothetical protein
VQLQDFAGEVLVEGSRLSVARKPPSANLRLRANRDDVVQIFQHARVAADRLEHVGEAAEDVGADRLPLIGRDGGANDGAGPADGKTFDQKSAILSTNGCSVAMAYPARATTSGQKTLL